MSMHWSSSYCASAGWQGSYCRLQARHLQRLYSVFQSEQMMCMPEVKLFLNLMSCFVAYLDRAELPLGGNRYQTAVDVVLLISVIAFVRNTQGKKPVAAEKETEIPMKGQTDMENSNEMEDMCRLASEIFDECLKIMLETGCDFSEANKAYAERHPEKYEKIHRYVSTGKEV